MNVARLQGQLERALPGTNPLVEIYASLGHLARRVGWPWPRRRSEERTHRLNLVTYWVVPGSLMAGTFPGSPDRSGSEAMLSSLVKRGVRAFIDLTEADEATWLGPLRAYQGDLKAVGEKSSATLFHSKFPIRDKGVPSRGLMTSILDALDAGLDGGAPTYVHCIGGRGRTGTVVGCYLIRHAERMLGATAGRDPGPLALARIAELRAAQSVSFAEKSPETQEQREFVLGWNGRS